MKKMYQKEMATGASASARSRRGSFRGMLLLLAAVLMGSFAYSQSIEVTGKVTDEKGNVIYGASVLVKGTTRGVTTGADGSYTISAPGTGTLEFRFIGYLNQEVEVGGRTLVNVVMREDAMQLDEVVVTGYGTQRKRDLTGAVATIGADKLQDRPYPNVLQALQGQMAGVQITQSQGTPGMAPSIKIRGSSSINAGTTPLYVIDGVPMEDASKSSGADGSASLSFNINPLNNINPNDIESIDILKDASSAAIYGSRGANGVVIVTTKQGRAGKTQVNVNYEYGISTVNRSIDVMDAKEWIAFDVAARTNTQATERAKNPNYKPTSSTIIPAEFDSTTAYGQEWLNRIGYGTDWQDVLFRTAHSNNIQVSASGGNEKTQFMLSAGYLDAEGVVDQDRYDRMTVRSNVRHKISNRFDVGLNMSMSRMNAAEYGTAGKSDAVSLTVQNDPIFPLYVETGNLGFKDNNSIWSVFQNYNFQLWHPYSLTREMEKNKLTNFMQAVGYLNFNIIDGLSFKTSLSGDLRDVHYSQYWNSKQGYGYSAVMDAQGSANMLQNFNWVWENTLNYNKSFGDHSVTGLLGYTVQESRTDDASMSAASFPNDLVHTFNAGKVSSGSTSSTEWALISYIARGTYSYKGKYLASAALRADGCSRFGANNRWGYFPSASIGWRLSEEEFMSGASNWMDNLKLRVSYGVTGNNQIADYGAIGLLGYTTYASGGTVSTGMYTRTFPDKNLKWEKTSQINVGFDATLWNRVDVSYDYYYSRTRDLLLDVPIPVLTGFTSTQTNIGELQNQGMELNINSRNIVGKFNWTTNFNISGNRNKILHLGADDAPFIKTFNDAYVKFEVGQPMSNFFGYIFDGVIMTTADLSKYPVWPGSEAGDPKVRDVDGNGKITADDRTIIGNYQPDFTWGLTNTFTWKGIELTFMLTGSQGGEIMNQQARFSKSFNGDRNAYKFVTNYWKSESDPGNGQINKPRVTQNTVQHLSSTYWIEDGSFVRIKNLRLGYTLPQRWTNKIGVGAAKFYVNGENLYVFSDYPNYDPEGSTYQTGAYVGLDYGAYPNPTVWTIGINLNF